MIAHEIDLLLSPVIHYLDAMRDDASIVVSEGPISAGEMIICFNTQKINVTIRKAAAFALLISTSSSVEGDSFSFSLRLKC